MFLGRKETKDGLTDKGDRGGTVKAEGGKEKRSRSGETQREKGERQKEI